MANPNFKFCSDPIKKPVEFESLTIEQFNDDVVEVVRKFSEDHPDVRIRNTRTSDKYIVKNYGYKSVKDAIEYFNEQLKK